jgi:hypothetical protein
VGLVEHVLPCVFQGLAYDCGNVHVWPKLVAQLVNALEPGTQAGAPEGEGLGVDADTDNISDIQPIKARHRRPCELADPELTDRVGGAEKEQPREQRRCAQHIMATSQPPQVVERGSNDLDRVIHDRISSARWPTSPSTTSPSSPR